MDPLERITWLRSNALPGVEFLSCEHNTSPFNAFHERYAVCTLLSGIFDCRYRGRPLVCRSNGISFMEPGELSFTTRIFKPGDFNVLFISPEVYSQVGEQFGLTREIHFLFQHTLANEPTLFQSIQKLHAAIIENETPLEQQSWLELCIKGMQAFSERAPSFPSVKNDGPAIKQAMCYLREHYQEPVNLEELAALTRMNRYSLLRAFSKRVGMPPHAYQIHVRIERARAFLELGLPPSLVAADTGFADQSHFARHFKRVLQVTPGQYARAMRHKTIFQ